MQGMKQQLSKLFNSGPLTQSTLFLLIGSLCVTSLSAAQKPQSLMSVIAKWHYPESALSGSTLNDAATVDRAGERTIQSLQYRTVMTTKDSLAEVIEYYKTKLVNSKTLGTVENAEGRSVTFLEDSVGRPLAIHLILVNDLESSTTLVISRAGSENETHIAWSRYLRL